MLDVCVRSRETHCISPRLNGITTRINIPHALLFLQFSVVLFVKVDVSVVAVGVGNVYDYWLCGLCHVRPK